MNATRVRVAPQNMDLVAQISAACATVGDTYKAAAVAGKGMTSGQEVAAMVAGCVGSFVVGALTCYFFVKWRYVRVLHTVPYHTMRLHLADLMDEIQSMCIQHLSICVHVLKQRAQCSRRAHGCAIESDRRKHIPGQSVIQPEYTNRSMHNRKGTKPWW